MINLLPKIHRHYSWNRCCLFLGALLFTLLIFLPGLGGGFEFDDIANIIANPHLKLEGLTLFSLRDAAFSGFAGPLGRPLSMLSFALNYYFTGFDPFYFKLTNLIIHLLAGLGVYVLSRRLLAQIRRSGESALTDDRAAWMALAITAAWLWHPLNLTSVLYVVQRMASLSGLFAFWALALYVMGRIQINEGNLRAGIWRIVVGAVLFGGLSMLSKENGALVPFYMLVVEITMFQFCTPTGAGKRFLLLFYVVSVLLPVLVGLAFLLLHPHWLAVAYEGRDFTLAERLLTQACVLFFYLRLAVFPTLPSMGIFHDDFPLSRGIFDPWTTAPAVFGIGVLLIIAILTIKRAPVLSFGLLWFFVGQSLESTILPLDMVYEHRNYVPLYGILFAGFYYFFHPRLDAIPIKLRAGGAVFVLAGLALSTGMRANQWSTEFGHALSEVRNHPLSSRANYQMGRMYFMRYAAEGGAENYDQARVYFLASARLSGPDINPLVALIELAYKAGQPLDPAWLQELQQRLARLSPYVPNVTALGNLVNCQVNGYCRLPDQDMIAVLAAVLRNPKASPRVIGDASTLLGNYYATKLHDNARAGRYYAAAVRAEPNLALRRVALARWYALNRQFTDCEHQLQMATTVDRTGEYRRQIKAARVFANSLMNQKAR